MNENETNLPAQAEKPKDITPTPSLAPKKRTRTVKPALAATPTESVEVPIEAPFIDPYEKARRELKEKIAKERAHKAQLVTGKFIFNECPGGELKFPYREFPGDQLVNYTFRHDQIYTIPLGVAMHLNDRCAYFEYQHNLETGTGSKMVDVQNMYIQTKVHRTNFIPLNFTTEVGYTQPRGIAQVINMNMSHQVDPTRRAIDELRS